ncbi:hypothetical protein DERF_007548 [Dermatophagoides farinae]|uniref:Uncharacterized protein n=1 Tax=Dermatophagoides farinae TaxID=6954 RepID=A0A922I3P5_DERFA|nr:hypothetical protein DERF_007548 [Dermatophagoides farinae]
MTSTQKTIEHSNQQQQQHHATIQVVQTYLAFQLADFFQFDLFFLQIFDQKLCDKIPVSFHINYMDYYS